MKKFKLLFTENPHLKVIAEAFNGKEAIDMAMKKHPDIINL